MLIGQWLVEVWRRTEDDCHPPFVANQVDEQNGMRAAFDITSMTATLTNAMPFHQFIIVTKPQFVTSH